MKASDQAAFSLQAAQPVASVSGSSIRLTAATHANAAWQAESCVTTSNPECANLSAAVASISQQGVSHPSVLNPNNQDCADASAAIISIRQQGVSHQGPAADRVPGVEEGQGGLVGGVPLLQGGGELEADAGVELLHAGAQVGQPGVQPRMQGHRLGTGLPLLHCPT